MLWTMTPRESKRFANIDVNDIIEETRTMTTTTLAKAISSIFVPLINICRLFTPLSFTFTTHTYSRRGTTSRHR